MLGRAWGGSLSRLTATMTAAVSYTNLWWPTDGVSVLTAAPPPRRG